MRQILTRDKWGRHECFLAEWTDPVGASSRCMFSNLDAAIFFVISGIGAWADWSNFPDPAREYPYEERDGSRDFTPIFRIEQTVQAGAEWAIGKKITGAVTKMAIADTWTVGNGIAIASKTQFLSATGRDEVALSGSGDRLCASVGSKHPAERTTQLD